MAISSVDSKVKADTQPVALSFGIVSSQLCLGLTQKWVLRMSANKSLSETIQSEFLR